MHDGTPGIAAKAQQLASASGQIALAGASRAAADARAALRRRNRVSFMLAGRSLWMMGRGLWLVKGSLLWFGLVYIAVLVMVTLAVRRYHPAARYALPRSYGVRYVGDTALYPGWLPS